MASTRQEIHAPHHNMSSGALCTFVSSHLELELAHMLQRVLLLLHLTFDSVLDVVKVPLRFHHELSILQVLLIFFNLHLQFFHRLIEPLNHTFGCIQILLALRDSCVNPPAALRYSWKAPVLSPADKGCVKVLLQTRVKRKF